jgi:hypothetical protein
MLRALNSPAEAAAFLEAHSLHDEEDDNPEHLLFAAEWWWSQPGNQCTNTSPAGDNCGNCMNCWAFARIREEGLPRPERWWL